MIVLNLSEYQAANLRWLLRKALEPGFDLNTGDWNAELIWGLESAMKDAGTTYKANRSDYDHKPLGVW